MSNEDWKVVENTLASRYYCNLSIDGYEIRLALVPFSTTKNVIYVFVDGKNIARCCLEDCDIRRRFCQPHKHSRLSAVEKKKLKRERKDVREEVEKMTTYYVYYPWWESFRSLKSHLTANNKEITVAQEWKEVENYE